MTTPIPENPWLSFGDEPRFELDEHAFMAEVEPPRRDPADEIEQLLRDWAA